MPFSFTAGIIWDNLTLRRIDLFYENTIFIWNLAQIFILILLISAYDAGKLRGKIFDRVIPFLPIFMQFAFGNLFSGFVIFYTRSSSVYTSWPFLSVLLILFLGNDFLRKRYLRLAFQLSVLFIALFSYSVFILPVLMGRMGSEIFLLSGAAALLILGLVILLLFFVARERLKPTLKAIFLSIGTIYIAFNFSYFTNIIPPIPLSIKESGIYHSIERINANGYIYKITFEPESNRLLFFKDQSDVFSWKPGDIVYGYSAIFSPANLNVPIFHRWMYFDEKTHKWTEYAKVYFNVTGGRDRGYRGYSFVQNVSPGEWRLDVSTERGQVLGRKNFTIVKSDSALELETAFR